MKIRVLVLALVAGALAAPAALQAQVEVRVVHRGLLGVFTESSSADGNRQRVHDVVPGSPAERAGVQRGDVVISINGTAATDAVMRAPIAPGETVVMRILRDGAERDFTLVATERPASAALAYARPVLPDSVMREIAVIMSNVRTEIDTLVFQGGRLRAVPAPGADNIVLHFGADSVQVLRFGQGDSVRVTRYGVAQRPFLAADSLLRAITLDRDSLFMRRFDPAAPHIELERLPDGTRFRMTHTPGMSDSARAAMVEAITSGRLMLPSRADSAGQLTRPADIFSAGFTVGMRAVAGAELSELNPDLAQYFGVTGGVLVLNAAEGTPAARAGMRAGDVIVRVNDTAVASIPEVRRAMDVRSGTTSVRVLRRGQPIDLTITR